MSVGSSALPGRCTISVALNRVDCLRELAEECRQIAALSSSTEMRMHYLRLEEHYSALAEAEELSTLAYGEPARALRFIFSDQRDDGAGLRAVAAGASQPSSGYDLAIVLLASSP